MSKWKDSVQYFKNEKVRLKMLLDYDYLNEVSNSRFGADTAHSKIITKFIDYDDENKKEYFEYVLNNCNVH